MASKLNPLYGHESISWPVSLSLNFRERGPHFEKPSAEPQVLLIVSGPCVIKKVWTMSVLFNWSDDAETKGVGFSVK